MMLKYLLALAAAVSITVAAPIPGNQFEAAAPMDGQAPTTTQAAAAPMTTQAAAPTSSQAAAPTSSPAADPTSSQAAAPSSTSAAAPASGSAVALSSTPAVSSTSDSDKAVFAHFIVGNAQNFSPEDWTNDITLAKEAKIDGFALNIAVQDSTTDAILKTAYDAAAAVGGFKMFMSFDYLSGGAWSSSAVIDKINTYKSHPAQFMYKGQPLVSTFEGVDNAGDWPGIKSATGCFVVPSWTSMGPGFADHADQVDGAFSWDLWAEGAADKDTSSDEMWIKMLGDKPYMMGVAPWFYTNLPQWGKNWLWRGDDLWFQRWQQIIQLQPQFVEIVTWNDFGETHYIGPIHANGIPDGAQAYVNDMPHDSWRTLLPYYIDAYKSGNTADPFSDPAVKEKITYWYRQNPSSAGSTGGTTGNNPAEGQPALPPAEVSQDKVFVSVLVKEPSQVSVQIGSGQATTLQAESTGVNHFSVPFNGATGKVSIAVTRGGQTIVQTDGAEITDQCANGQVNWNALVGESE